MKCPKCGFELKEEDNFCSECGAPLKKEYTEVKSRNFLYKKIAFIVSLIILFVLILGAVLSNCEFVFTDYETAQLKEMTYHYNSEWVQETLPDGAIYEADGGKFMTLFLYYKEDVTYDDVKEFVTLLGNAQAYSMTESNDVNFNVENADIYYFYDNYESESGYSCYYDCYIFVRGNRLFVMTFNGFFGDKGTQFNKCKNYIINHIEFSEEDIEPKEYSLYTLNEMRYSVNSKWSKEKITDGSIFCDYLGNSMTVTARVYNKKVTDAVVDMYIEEFKISEGYDIEEKVNDKVFDISNSYYRYEYYSDAGYHKYIDLYVFYQGNTMYLMCFNAQVSGENAEFEVDKAYILNDLSFDETTYTEPITTEPPTEKPTDITEPMTLLYDDNNISVYYSDVQQGYREDRVDVHLFVDNKTDKSIVVYSDTIILDKISYNDIYCADQISADTRGMIEISVNNCSNIKPLSVGADLRYRYSDYSEDSVDLYINSKSVK
jgi:predicted nucleic acid-binding Zn ribbon protein